MKKKIIIIGGVAGGASTAARARRLSEEAEIIIFERGPDISFANCGLPYHIGGEIADRGKLLLHTPQSLAKRFALDVRVKTEVTAIDRERKIVKAKSLVDGRIYEESYDDLVISTGAKPIFPPLPGIDLDGIFTLRDLTDMDRIISWIDQHKAKSATVVGGGFIGIEMIEQLAHRGLKLSLVEAAPQILPPIDEEMARIIETEIRNKGITVAINSAVAEFRKTTAGLEIRTAKNKSFTSDLVILAIGVRPDSTLAKEAGLKIGATGGIVVDELLRTEDPCIWAVGDVIETINPITVKPQVVPLGGPANRQGRIVADNIFGAANKYRGTIGTAIVRAFGLTAAVTGVNERILKREKILFEKVYLHPNSHASYYPGAKPITLKLLFSPENRKILGAQAVGEDGVDKRIDVIATAINGKMTVDDLVDLELCYAPPFGSAKDPINLAGMVSQNTLNGFVQNIDPLSVSSRPKEILLLDVRSVTEREKGCIPESIHIPLDELRERIKEIPKDREIVVYCHSGQRSYNAARILSQNGFTVKNLSGAWKSYCHSKPVA